ncbi:membrane-associated proteins in eicosanoid and glutathione metabolism [Gloeophyllum trabeum ATCC 11539]|uniref:Membrane-associated proteins in eicosanoid and glutathione metabolism n=1 Tax=Gloeophyllum trabeum (strain ATCC 11539 / FP-39264 / Madison 617) TaxID=670483 RepID=S7S3V5_GLOTA|nr:membrane-associated proteins in eicosanoid and glutathione metabolism [Gloeophyllum trabeum ATCC 11539]EPQ60499.1 membrane-associated proteins in eicosanoid and glutathione metabolism [Gloeophyllum trabeum ATCC 11539]
MSGYSTIVVPQGISYVAAAIFSNVCLLTWQSYKAGFARKAARIPYPQLYAEKAEAQASKEAHRFNCAQRAHQNTLEQLPIVLISTILVGLKRPILAASLCGAWSFARVLYTIGYATGDPERRNTSGGALFYLAQLGLLFSAAYTTVEYLVAGL